MSVACLSPSHRAKRFQACHVRRRTMGMGAASEERVDERRQPGRLTEHQQDAEQEEDGEHRHHPPELLPPQKLEELAHDAEPLGRPLEYRHGSLPAIDRPLGVSIWSISQEPFLGSVAWCGGFALTLRPCCATRFPRAG